MYKNFLFDLDGTLIDSSKDIIEGVNYTLSTFNIPPMDGKLIMSYVGKGLRQLLASVLKNYPEHVDKAYLIQKDYYDVKEVKATLYEGVENTLKTLKEQNKKLFVVTNKPHTPTLNVLKHLKIDYLFDGIYGADILPFHKPSPLITNYICDNFNLNKEETIFIGDSITDFETAKNGKIDFILVDYGFENSEILAEIKADYKFSNFCDILKLI